MLKRVVMVTSSGWFLSCFAILEDHHTANKAGVQTESISLRYSKSQAGCGVGGHKGM